MAAVVVVSNILVQFPFEPFGLDELLTWGAFTYPIAFFVTDMTNRRFGPRKARLVVYCGFALAVVLSSVLATPRIAVASGTAFLLAQLLDVFVFNRLRHAAWWRPPLISSAFGSLLDTSVFFTLAFAGTGIGIGVYSMAGFTIEAPIWMGWAAGDLLVKLLVALALLIPFGILRQAIPRLEAVANGQQAGSR